MSVIELGRLGPPSDDPDTGPHYRPGRPADHLRPALIVAVVIACLLACTGSARSDPQVVRPLWSATATGRDGTFLTSDTAFLYHLDGDLTRITAYVLATGAVRWQRALPGAIGYPRTVEGLGLILVPSSEQVAEPEPGSTVQLAPNFHRETIAVDLATGAERWRVPGEPQEVTAESALMGEYAGDAVLTRMSLVRLADHATVWSRATPGVQNMTVAASAGRPDRIVTAGGSGDIKVYRWPDGEPVSSGRVPWVTPRPEDGYYNDLSAGENYLVVNRVQPNSFDLSVHRLDTMATAWSRSDTRGFGALCGPALCLNGGDDGISAFDLATGRRLWQLAGLGNVYQITDDRMVLDDGLEDGRPVLLDTATGKIVGQPGLGSTVWFTDPGTSLLLLHATHDPPGRLSVTRWDLASGRRHLLGSLDAMVNYHCLTVPGYLACLDDSVFRVTAVG